MEISEPAALTRLPRLQFEDGRYICAPVYGFRNDQKRKRREICVGADGNSINIYEIQNGRTLTSCPVPPDMILSCAPYAAQIQHTDNKVSRNIYYAGTRHEQLTLSVFTDVVGDSISLPSCKSIALDKGSPIVQLEILSNLDPLRLLVAREDGTFEIYDGKDLSCVGKGILNGTGGDDQLVFLRWLSPLQASKSVLKARSDLVMESESGTSLLVGVFLNRSGVNTEEQMLKIGGWWLGTSFWPDSDELHLNPIFYHQLALAGRLAPMEQDPIAMVRRDTRMIVKTHSKIYTYDLTSSIPSKIREASLIVIEQISSVSVSESLVLSSTQSSIMLHNTNFKTLQSKLDLNANGLKRKRGNSAKGQILLVAYSPKLNRAIAIQGVHLVAIDMINATSNTITSTFRQSSLLVNNLGRGVVHQEKYQATTHAARSSIGKLINTAEQKAQWQKAAKQFTELCLSHDTVGFEELFAEQVMKPRTEKSQQMDNIPGWKANFIVSKIFEVSNGPTGTQNTASRRLRLVLPALNALTILLEDGFLTAGKVFKALGLDFEQSPLRYEYRQFIDVLIENDASLDLVKRYLRRSAHVDQWEICAAIHALIQRALTGPQGVSLSDEVDQQVTKRDIVAGQEADGIRSCLCVAIERLCASVASSLSLYMRQHFRQTETVALIQFLRQELFRSGYTTSLQSQTHTSPPEFQAVIETQEGSPREPFTRITLSEISSVLSDCIDAIGPAGMLIFGEEGAFLQTLISELSVEIARASEALQDDICLRGFLRETLRFTESVHNNDHYTAGTDAYAGKPPSKHPGSILTLYSGGHSSRPGADNLAMLPLGLRDEGKINAQKVRKGDGSISRRSDREISMLQGRLRAPYTLERLII